MKKFLSIILFAFILFTSCNKSDEIKSTKFASNTEIFNQYYDKNVIDQHRGGPQEAITKFVEKDYDSAALLFNNIAEKDKNNIAAKFYYGVSSIESNDIPNSIKAFKTIINQHDNLYVEHAQWYLGLCYLKNDQLDSAIYEFMIIASDSTNFHNKDAKSILNQISTPVDFDNVKKVLHSQNEYVDNLLLIR